MQTRRDQLQAFRFLNRRALAALVTGEPNAVDPPMRRLTATTVSGVMIAALIVAGFAILGIIHPSVGSSWKDPGTVIIESQTGATYVYLGNELHPVLNYSSAVLAVTAKSQSKAKVVSVDRSDLKNTARGAPMGIDGLPQELPAPGALITSPWSACSRQSADDQGTVSARVTLYIGSDPAAAQKVATESAVVVKSVNGAQTFLLWHGMRLKIDTRDNVDRALNVQTAPSVVVGTAFLDAVPEGTPLRTPSVDGLGQDGPALNGQVTTVGQLLSDAQTDQYYVVLRHGFEAVNAVEAALLRTLAVASSNPRLQVRSIPDNVALNLQDVPGEAAALNAQFAGLPTAVPTIDPNGAQNGGLCAVYRARQPNPTFEVPPTLLTEGPAGAPTQSATSATGIADVVQLSPGGAAVIGSGTTSTTVYVVAGPGKKFAAASLATLAGFGYNSTTPVTLFSGLINLIPTGPALDQTAALATISN